MPFIFFFCGSAWSLPFLIGVYKGMIQKWGYLELSKCKFGGNSGGALIALCATLGITFEKIEILYNKLLQIAVLYGSFSKISIYHSIVLSDILLDINDYKKVNNKLFIGVTYFFNKNILISNWENNEELINTLHASMHIPFYCTYKKLLKLNQIAIDGSFSNTYNKIDSNTLIINPLSNNGHICNNISLLKCLAPLDNKKSNQLIKIGINQIKIWNGHYKKLESNVSFSNLIIIIVWILRFCEEISFYYIIYFIGFIFFIYN